MNWGGIVLIVIWLCLGIVAAMMKSYKENLYVFKRIWVYIKYSSLGLIGISYLYFKHHYK